LELNEVEEEARIFLKRKNALKKILLIIKQKQKEREKEEKRK